MANLQNKKTILMVLFLFIPLLQAQAKFADNLQESYTTFRRLLRQQAWGLLLLAVICAVVLFIFTRIICFIFRQLEQKEFINVSYGAMELALFSILYIVFQKIIADLTLYLIPKLKNTPHIFSLSVYWPINGLYCLALLFVFRYLYFQNWATMGLSKLKLKQALASILGYISFIPWYLSSFILALVIFAILGIVPQPQQVAKDILGSQGFEWWLGVATAVIAAPLFEEFLFRMFLFSGIRKLLGPYPAIFLSAIIFSLVHLNTFALLPIFTLGIFLGLLYERTQNLWCPILAHACHNGLTLCYLIFVG